MSSAISFDTVSFQDLLSISESQPDGAVIRWITTNLDRENTIDELLSSIGENPKYFHFYFEYARLALQRWNILPRKIIPSLEYLFRNLTQLSKQNVNIISAVDGYGFEIIFANPDVLSGITKIPLEEFDPEALIRFIRYYFRNYERNLNLREHKAFFQDSVSLLAVSKPEKMHDILGDRAEKLFEELGFTLSKGYMVFFEITKSEGRTAYTSDREIAHLRHMSEDAVLTEMEVMDMKTFCGFVDRFRNRVSEGRMHFLGFQDIMRLSDIKRFYLSLTYRKKIFSEQENIEFLTYCLKELEKDGGRIYGENLFSDLSAILEFFTLERIPLFKNKELFIRITHAVSKNERYVFAFEKYLKNLEPEMAPNTRFIRDVFEQIRVLDKVVVPIFTCFANQLLQYSSFSEYLDFMEDEYRESYIQSRLNGLSDILIATIPRTKGIGYRTEERFLRHLLSTGFLTEYAKMSVVKTYAGGSGRMRYLLMKNVHIWSSFISKYEMSSIREKCFSSRVFPIGFIHAVRYMFAKK